MKSTVRILMLMSLLVLSGCQGTVDDGSPTNSPTKCGDKTCKADETCNSAKKCVKKTVSDATGKCKNLTCKKQGESCDPADGKCKKDLTNGCTDAQCQAQDADTLCYNGKCTPKTAICTALACKRGEECILSGQDKKCVENDLCAKDDDCVEGKFCYDATAGQKNGSCEPNLCDTETILGCNGDSDGDVTKWKCDRKTGLCKNPDTCEKHSDCTVNNLCFKKDKDLPGECYASADVCKRCDASSNLTCAKNETDLDRFARCELVADKCNDSRDCLGNQACAKDSKECTTIDENTCTANENDDNFTGAIEVNPSDPNKLTTKTGTLCGKDTAVYAYKVDATAATGKNLTVQLTVARENIGLYPVELELYKEGELTTVLKSVKSELSDPNEAIKLSYRAEESATFYVKITAHSDRGTKKALINYEVAFEASDVPASSQCASPKEITLANGKTTSVENVTTTDQNYSTSLTSTCATDSEETPEVVYRFTLDHDSYIQIDAENKSQSTPEVLEQIALSIRKNCYAESGEICSNTRLSDGLESTKLEKGTYFLVVQNIEEGKQLNNFTLKINRHDIICTPGEAVACTDGDTSTSKSAVLEICNALGTEKIPYTCNEFNCDTDSNGKPACRSNSLGEPAYGTSCENPYLLLNDTSNPAALNKNTVIKANRENIKQTLAAGDLGCAEAGKYTTATPSTIPGVSYVNSLGSDTVIRVDAQKGQRIEATMTNEVATQNQPVLYILKGSCSGQHVCEKYIAGDGRNTNGVNEATITYDVKETNTYYVIGDYENPNPGTYSWKIDAKVVNPVCIEGETKCNDKGIKQQICDTTASPAKFIDEHECSTGVCESATKRCKLPDNNSCSDAKEIAIDATTGVGIESGYIDEYEERYEVQKDVDGSCITADAAGRSAYYKITPAAAGDRYDVKLTGPNTSNLLVVLAKDCSDATKLTDTCVGSLEKFGKTNNEISFIADSTDPVYLVVKGQTRLMRGSYTIDVQRHEKKCDAGTTKCNGTNLQVCSADGTTSTDYDCSPGNCDNSGGTATCTGGATQPADGQSCATAEQLTDGTPVNTNFDTFKDNKNYNPGTGKDGECTFTSAKEPKGPEKFYTIEVPAKNYLTIDYKAPSKTLVYIIDECKLKSNTCLALSDKVSGDGTLKWRNPSETASKTVYVVVDSSNETIATGTITLTPTLAEWQCETPGKALECSSSDKNLKVCDDNFQEEEVTCEFGCNHEDKAKPPFCNKPNNNTCDNIKDFDTTNGTKTYTFNANLANYKENFVHTAGSTPCDSYSFAQSPIGPDGIFSVKGNPKDKIRVTLTKVGVEEITLYRLNSCGDTHSGTGDDTVYNADDQCADGYHNQTYDTETITTTIPKDSSEAKLYYVVDSFKSKVASDSRFTLTVENLGRTFCYENEITCSDKDSSTRTPAIEHTCNSSGTRYASERTCYHGCGQEGCAKPDKGNLCKTDDKKMVVISQNDTIKDDLVDYTSDYAPQNDPTTCRAAKNSNDLAGNDAVYKITNTSGTPTDVTLTLRTLTNRSGSQNNLFMYLYSNCGDLSNANSCKDAISVDVYSPTGSIKYSLAADEAVYAVVDSRAVNKEGMPFELSVKFDNWTCPATNNTKCDENGFNELRCIGNQWIQYSCDGTCDTAKNKCTSYTNDICEGAEVIDISNIGSDKKEISKRGADLANYTNRYYINDSDKTNCHIYSTNNNSATTKELVYKIEGNKGQIVRIVPKEYNNLIYLVPNLNSCSNTAKCIENKGLDFWPYKSETLFKMPSTSVYLVAEIGENASYEEGVSFVIDSPTTSSDVTPDETWCEPKAGRYVYTSDKLGVYKAKKDTCYFGCDTAKTECKSRTNTSCTDAQEVNLKSSANSTFLYGTINEDTMLPSHICSSFDSGQLVYYKVTAPAEHVIRIKSTNEYVDTEFGELYTFNDDACSTCNNEGKSTIQKVVPTTGSFTVALKANKSYDEWRNSYKLEFTDLGPKVCDNIGEVTCDGDFKKVCQGTHFDKISCTNCTKNGANPVECTNKNNDTCQDAIEISDGFHYEGTLSNYTSQNNPECTGLNLSSDDKKNGRNMFFKFTLPPNSYFKASLTNNEDADAFMWLSTDCSDANACTDYEKAPYTSNYFKDFAITKSNTTNQSKDYYLVVDTKYYDSTYPNLYTLDVSITQMCNYGLKECSNENILKECPDGTYLKETYCNGGCDSTSSNPHCVTVDNYQCSGAEEIDLSSSKATKKGTFKAFSSSYGNWVGESCGSRRFSARTGYYKVNLNAGDTVNYTITMPELDSYNRGKDKKDWDYPYVYITKACSSSIECIDYTEGNDSKGEFKADTTGEYFIIVQERQTLRDLLTHPAGYYELKLEKNRSPKSCDPNSITCDASSTPATLTSCNATTHESISISCPPGMQCNSSNNHCLNGALDYNTGSICPDAIDASDSTYTSGAVQNNTSFNAITLSGDQVPEACKTVAGRRLTKPTFGNEMYYKHSIAGKSRLYLSYDTTSEDATVYFLVDGCEEGKCAAVSQSRNANRTWNSAKTIEYENTSGSTQDVYIVFDSQVPGDEYDFNFTAWSEKIE